MTERRRKCTRARPPCTATAATPAGRAGNGHRRHPPGTGSGERCDGQRAYRLPGSRYRAPRGTGGSCRALGGGSRLCAADAGHRGTGTGRWAAVWRTPVGAGAGHRGLQGRVRFQAPGAGRRAPGTAQQIPGEGLDADLDLGLDLDPRLDRGQTTCGAALGSGSGFWIRIGTWIRIHIWICVWSWIQILIWTHI